MPARLVVTATGPELATLFGLSRVPAVEPCFNVAPPEPIPVVRVTRGVRELTELQWGLILYFSGDPPGEAHVNARAETVSRKPSFRDAFRARRGVVPVSGFYGWKGTAGRKRPYYFRPSGGGVFACAAVWDRWTGLDGTLETVAVLTLPANELVAPCDDRMPVVLGPEQVAAWLDPNDSDPTKRVAPLLPFPAERMECWPVSTRVNSPTEDDSHLLLPVPEPE